MQALYAQAKQQAERLEAEVTLAKSGAATAAFEAASSSEAGGVPESNPAARWRGRGLPPLSPRGHGSSSAGSTQGLPLQAPSPPPMRAGAAKALVAATAGARGVAGLAQLFEQHPHDPDLLARAARAVKDLCASSTARDGQRSGSSGQAAPVDPGAVARVAVGASGLCGLLCAAMAAHPTHLALQREGCRAAGNASFGSDANRRRLGAAGGCACVVASLRVSAGAAHDAELGAAACAALCNLAHGGSGNGELLERAGAAGAVCAGMRAWPLDARVQKQACWALLTLAASDPLAAQARKAGGAAALVAALVNCPRDAAVQHFGCWALANLTWDSGGGAPGRGAAGGAAADARAQGAEEVCRAAARRFPNHPGVVEKASLALEHMGAV